MPGLAVIILRIVPGHPDPEFTRYLTPILLRIAPCGFEIRLGKARHEHPATSSVSVGADALGEEIGPARLRSRSLRIQPPDTIEVLRQRPTKCALIGELEDEFGGEMSVLMSMTSRRRGCGDRRGHFCRSPHHISDAELS